MRGFTDLHCHWVPGIDDGAPSMAAGLQMLRALRAIGFDRVIATPHMRPGLFDNTRSELERAYAEAQSSVLAQPDLPEVALACEHYFDEIVYGRLISGDALPYPGASAALLEFYQVDFPPTICRQLFELKRRGMLPVIAHPERYQCLWRSLDTAEMLVDGGAALLLDTAALVGKYGSRPQRCAEQLLERGLYHAACSDAHRPADVDDVHAGMHRLESEYGAEEVEFLFRDGPRELLAGRVPE
jgi:protein-tyrosine phosphatase